jgi:hypothetical protein
VVRLKSSEDSSARVSPCGIPVGPSPDVGVSDSEWTGRAASAALDLPSLGITTVVATTVVGASHPVGLSSGSAGEVVQEEVSAVAWSTLGGSLSGWGGLPHGSACNRGCLAWSRPSVDAIVTDISPSSVPQDLYESKSVVSTQSSSSSIDESHSNSNG